MAWIAKRPGKGVVLLGEVVVLQTTDEAAGASSAVAIEVGRAVLADHPGWSLSLEKGSALARRMLRALTIRVSPW
jgi:hypothetical protein